MPAEGRENPLLKKGNSDAFFREKYLTKNNHDGTVFSSSGVDVPREDGERLEEDTVVQRKDSIYLFDKH